MPKRSTRLRGCPKALSQAIYEYYSDRYLRGPGTPNRRKGVPIPEALLELQVAEWSQWRIMPWGLRPGCMDDQPIAALMYWLAVQGEAVSNQERCEAMLHAQASARARRRR